MRASGTKGQKRIDHTSGGHDDVVMACALADWLARSKRIGTTVKPTTAPAALAQPVAGKLAALKARASLRKPTSPGRNRLGLRLGTGPEGTSSLLGPMRLT